MSTPTDRPDDLNLGARGEWLARVSEAARGLATSHPPEQPRGSWSGSTVTVSYTSLPPSPDKSPGLHPTTELASWLSRPAQLNSEQAIPRLIVQSSRVSSGEPIPLGVALRGRADGAVVIIKGLVPGMDLSVGNAIGTDAWQLPATDLGDAWIAPPESFVGSTNLVVELRLSDDKMADQQMIQFEWVLAIAPPAGTHGQSQEIAAGPLLLPPPTEKASAGSSIPPPQAERPPEEITTGPWISPSPMRNPGKIAAEGQRRRDVFWQLAEAAAALPISPSPTQFQPQAIAMEPPISPPPTDRQLEEATGGPPISPSPTQFQPQVIAVEPPTSPPLTDRQLGDAVAGPPISPLPTQLQSQVIAMEPPIAPPPAQRILDREEIAVLLKRGKDLIANGDLSAARLVLRRAADANDAEAALALGATYDPYVLRALKVYGFKADPVMASVWYEKARELGSAAAPRRLEMLASGMR
jgi:hypothetical protein